MIRLRLRKRTERKNQKTNETSDLSQYLAPCCNHLDALRQPLAPLPQNRTTVAISRADGCRAVVLLSRHMEKPLAGIDRDIAFDIAIGSVPRSRNESVYPSPAKKAAAEDATTKRERSHAASIGGGYLVHVFEAVKF